MNNNQYTPDFIQTLAENEVFVFGSNPQGQHNGGAARCALMHFGAIMSVGEGLQGQSYAIPTKGCSIEEIRAAVARFIDFARRNPDRRFFVTRIGCGMAGYSPEDMAPLFKSALELDNVVLPKEFATILEADKPREKRYLDLIKGSLVAGAAGDALGYAVEFMRLEDIKDKYGPQGITKFRILEEDALISDDTQMTLFTAAGLLNAWNAGQHSCEEMLDAVKRAYIEWYGTQVGLAPDAKTECWITKVPALNHRRAPGYTCMGAMHCILHNQEVDNFSKGCGGVMRTAPVALLGAAQGLDIELVDHLAAECARLTHKHPLGYLPSLVAAHIIYYCVLHPSVPTVAEVEQWMQDSFVVARRLYGGICPSAVQGLKAKMDDWMAIAHDTTLIDEEAVRRIGEGWVGDEALGIALSCVVRHPDDMAAALIMSVNHDGDSDSTGAITGNILGSIVGYSSIPQHLRTNLEASDVVLQVAVELGKGKEV